MKKIKKTIDFNTRSSVFTGLNQFCHFAASDDYMEVTMWSNYEGYDVTISDRNGLNTFSMTDGEFDALKKLIKSMSRQEEIEFEQRKEKYKKMQSECLKKDIISEDDLPF